MTFFTLILSLFLTFFGHNFEYFLVFFMSRFCWIFSLLFSKRCHQKIIFYVKKICVLWWWISIYCASNWLCFWAHFLKILRAFSSLIAKFFYWSFSLFCSFFCFFFCFFFSYFCSFFVPFFASVFALIFTFIKRKLRCKSRKISSVFCFFWGLF